MITASEFFANNGKPKEQVSEMVNQILEKIETNLAQGTLVFQVKTKARHVAMTKGSSTYKELKNSGYLQLINELINDELSKFEWVAYISENGLSSEYLVKLAIKGSELESVKQQIKIR